MGKIEEFKSKMGQNITDEILAEIASNFIITKHARDQLLKRSNASQIQLKRDVVDMLLRSIFGYYNTDGSVNIAINRWNYFVFVYNEDNDLWVLVTYKEMSLNGIDIYEKQKLAQRGVDRKI